MQSIPQKRDRAVVQISGERQKIQRIRDLADQHKLPADTLLTLGLLALIQGDPRFSDTDPALVKQLQQKPVRQGARRTVDALLQERG